MKTRMFIISYGFVLVAILLVTPLSYSQGTDPNEQRWDLVMIKEAHIWNNLLKNYAYADHNKFWPDTKASLQQVLTNWPDSRWADDAALMLAGGKASFENDPAGAINDLERIISEYPNGKTVVVGWNSNRGCYLDETWIFCRAGLVSLDSDGSVRFSRPFDRDDKISQKEEEALAYFEHIHKYPRSTKVTAQLVMAQIKAQNDNIAGAIEVLEEVTSNCAEYFAATVHADKIAASEKDGYHIRHLQRPEFKAYIFLIGYYEGKGKPEKAITTVDEFTRFANDSPRWDIIKRLGKFYDKHGLETKARAEYQLALTTIKNHMKLQRERNRHLEFADPNDADRLPNLTREKENLRNLATKKN